MIFRTALFVLASLLLIGAPLGAQQRVRSAHSAPTSAFLQFSAHTDSARRVNYGRHILLGSLSGALLGAGIGAFSYRLHPGDSESFSQTTQIVSSAVAGAIVGALSGWIIAAVRD